MLKKYLVDTDKKVKTILCIFYFSSTPLLPWLVISFYLNGLKCTSNQATPLGLAAKMWTTKFSLLYKDLYWPKSESSNFFSETIQL